MSTATETIENLVGKEYKYGFYTDVEADSAPPGLNEDIVRFISAKKKEPEFMLDWRLKAYRRRGLESALPEGYGRRCGRSCATWSERRSE